MKSLTPLGERSPVAELERRYGTLGGREIRAFPFHVEEVRDSGAGKGQFTIRGYAAVYNEWSLDLGFFRERILPGAFDDVLAQRSLDVWHLWDHDTRLVLARTANGTLELGSDERGLRFWSRVAPTSYAEDLRTLLDRRDIDQSSFAFTVADDEWRIRDEDGEETIERDVIKVADLLDVTTTAMGAYPQTSSELVRAYLRTYDSIPEDCRALLGGQDDPAVETPEVVAPRVNPRVAVSRAKARARVTASRA